MDENTVVRSWHVTQWGDDDQDWSLTVWEHRVMETFPGSTGHGESPDPVETLRGTKDVVLERRTELLGL